MKLSDSQRDMLERLANGPQSAACPGDGRLMATRAALIGRGLVEVRRVTYNRAEGVECYVITDKGREVLS